MNSTSQRLSTLDALRGLAALAVCWFHFTNGVNFLPKGLLKASGVYGYLGVQIFFVISGFVIPYALNRSKYTLSDFGKFMLKRLVRLEPPYLVTALFSIVLLYASAARHTGSATNIQISWIGVALHVGFLPEIFGYPWLCTVFWTLGIEAQYYLLAGMLFFLISNKQHHLRIIGLLGMSMLAITIPDGRFIFHWLFSFLLGMVAFQYHARLISAVEFCIWIVLFSGGACYVNSLSVAIAAGATALIIGLVRTSRSHSLLFFGDISYSLYLVHAPIGIPMINLAIHYQMSFFLKTLYLLFTLGVVVGAAWLLHKFVEQPAQIWSSAIRYNKRRENKSCLNTALK